MRPKLHELYHNLGSLLHQQGDFLGAIENYRQALMRCPSFAECHYALGNILADQQQYPASIAHFQQAIALNPSYGEAYNNLGCVFLRQGKIEQAVQIFQQGIAQQPDLAALHNSLGQALLDRDREVAIRAFRRALELQPGFVPAYRNLGRLFWQNNGYRDALRHFQLALVLNPSEPEIWSDCVVNWLALGQIDEALGGFHQLIQANQHQVDAYCEWALQLTDTDDLSQAHLAAAHFFQSLQYEKNHANSSATAHSSFSAGTIQFLSQIYFYLGSILSTYGGNSQYERAEAYLQKAIRLQPQNLQPYLKLAHCLIQQKRWNAALLVCDAAEVAVPAGKLVSFAPNAIEIANLRRLIEEAHEQENENSSSDRGSSSTSSLSSSSSQLSSSSPSSSSAIEVEQHFKKRLEIAGIASVQDWLNQQSHPNRGEGATEEMTPRYISLADSASLASQPASHPALPPTHHSPCGGINCPTCLQQTTAAFQPHYLSRSLCRIGGQGHVVSPAPRFTVHIPEGRVWAVPQQNRWLICTAIAVFSPDHHLLTDLSRSYPIGLPCSPPFDPDQHPLFSQTSLPPIDKIEGQVAVLAGLSGHNYFHWMVDVLPRFEILRQSGIDLSEIDWFYLNSPRAAFQQATLQKLGIPLDRVLSSDQHPHIQADHLIVPSFTGDYGWLQPWMLEFLRQEFLPLASAHSPIGDRFPERLYISRAGADHRHVLNEAAVLEMLQEFGFVSVKLEELSFADQIALFANAKVIVAPHGGGLTNLIFCNPGTALLEFFSPHYIRHYYWVVSQVLGMKHYCLLSEPIKSHPLRELMYASPLFEDLWIDLETLRSGLEQIGI